MLFAIYTVWGRGGIILWFAQTLHQPRNLIESVLFMSEHMIGVRWGAKLSQELDTTDCGILCMTLNNTVAPWVLFEAGSLAKKVDEARVIPYLLNVAVAQLPQALSQFQCVAADREGTLRLVKMLNDHSGAPVSTNRLEDHFHRLWDSLDLELRNAVNIPTDEGGPVFPFPRHPAVGLWEDNRAIPEDIRPLKTINGRDFMIRGLAWSLDGKYLAFNGSENTFHLLDYVTEKELYHSIMHSHYTYDLSWSSTRVATASRDGTIQIWDPLTRGPAPVSLDLRPYDFPFGLSWSPDGTMLAVGTKTGKVLIYRPPDNIPYRTLLGHASDVNNVAWSPKGDKLASVSDDRTARVWRADWSDTVLARGHHDIVVGVAWSPNGRLLVTGSEDENIVVWDVENERMIRPPLNRHSKSVFSIAFSRDGEYLASASRGGLLQLWEVRTWNRLLQMPSIQNEGGIFPVVAFSPTADLLATLSRDGKQMLIWEVPKLVAAATTLHHGRE
jgi:WD40 repeat protein